MITFQYITFAGSSVGFSEAQACSTLLLLLLLSTNIYKTPLSTLRRAQMRSLEMTVCKQECLELALKRIQVL